MKTNLEAAEEIARQVRLRDLAGLVVIDFIDMEDTGNNRAVERKLKDCLRSDRARIQLGNISAFGLLEMSRQRLRPSLVEASGIICPRCNGSGVARSTENIALQIIRVIEEEGIRGRSTELTVSVASEIALYILNSKRDRLAVMEGRYGLRIIISADPSLNLEEHNMQRVAGTPVIQGEPLGTDTCPLEEDGEETPPEEAENETSDESSGNEEDRNLVGGAVAVAAKAQVRNILKHLLKQKM